MTTTKQAKPRYRIACLALTSDPGWDFEYATYSSTNPDQARYINPDGTMGTCPEQHKVQVQDTPESEWRDL